MGFVMEVYDSIIKNYWQKVDPALLAEHFKSSVKTVPNPHLPSDPVLTTRYRAGIEKMLGEVFEIATTTASKKRNKKENRKNNIRKDSSHKYRK